MMDHLETSRPTCEYIPLLHFDIQNRSSNSGMFLRSRETQKHWPWFVWFLLKCIGLFNYRRIVTKRRCHRCRLATYGRQYRERPNVVNGHLFPREELENGCLDEEEPLTCVIIDIDEEDNHDDSETRDDACAVCLSKWLDARGRSRPYSETDIGVHKWNHRGSTILSVIWPLVLIALTMYDFLWYLIRYWGQEEQIIRLISYSAFLLFIISIPVLSLTANVMNIILDHRGTRADQETGFRWHNALSIRYIVKRLQHLELAEKGLPHKAFLAVCLIWPCLNGVYRVVIYYGIVNKIFVDEVHVQISLDVCMVGMMLFGGFCYLMLLLRISFQKQLRHELLFLWRHAGALDVCRRRLALCAEELGSLCRLVFIWILFVVAVSTWAFTTQISWDYIMISRGITNSEHAYIVIYNLKALIWSEDIMFILLPFMAVGGIDLNRLWTQFRRNISQLRCAAHEDFWDKILACCHEQSPVTRVKALTLMFSALGIFLGLQFTDQNIAYWSAKDGIHNSTTLHKPSY